MVAIRVPVLPSDVYQATVLAWHKKPGHAVSRGTALVDLEIAGNKQTITAPVAGVLQKIYSPNGATVHYNDLLAVMKTGLPVFDEDSNVDMNALYVPSAEEFNAQTQLALQQLLAQEAARYANKVQSLPPKWESQSEMGMGVRNNPYKEHPAFANLASARKEEHVHPSDLQEEQLAQAELTHSKQHQKQHQMSHSYTPRPTPR